MTRQAQGKRGASAWLLIRKSGAQTFDNHELQPFGVRNNGRPEARLESAVAVRRSSPGARQWWHSRCGDGRLARPSQ